MNASSEVQFETDSRVHMGLAVRNVEKSIAFYTSLLGQPPTKTRPGYAKFETAEPPMNLSLNQVDGQTGQNNPVAHFGIQVKSSEAVRLVADRIQQAGLETRMEENVTCCYAVQDKAWVSDPDGNNWEVYVVLDNDGQQHASNGSSCCPGIPSVMQAVEQGDLPAAQNAFQEAGGMTACSCLGTAAN
ncbi:Cadmium-induced protein CadI [Maioricimonas rarisocia]|uniref:Cadmium-induced protein CadI n=1 Tax=Maioricimonas rarisocia TaxID=2528026 RepID=A0A517ZEI3_9PLAN|nr:ArsI/CadI family heavy metal resistance metalloenzyme [Maioricimonas rarisocia]QDU40839.1 Cadmium-induced protein CadI [Maioricimonas rarisocia]